MPLASWNRVVAEHGSFPLLLTGNGASRAVWNHFRYDDIYERALNAQPALLSNEEVRHFDGGTNFEVVLSDLLTAERMSRQAGRGNSARYFRNRYERIQNALVSAIKAVHVPYPRVDDSGVLEAIADAIEPFNQVFTTNYDLLLYWSILRGNEERGYNRFKDYFFSNDDDITVRFSMDNSQIWPDPRRTEVTGVLYLHGALHLVRTAEGETHKLCRRDGQYLLERFGEEVLGGASPLVVTEGTSEGKLKSFDRSGYLAFALSKLTESRDNIVIFGHSLSSQDEHIAKAIKWERGIDRVVAVGMRPNPDEEGLEAEQNRIEAALHPRLNVVFFDSTTFPLGVQNLRV